MISRSLIGLFSVLALIGLNVLAAAVVGRLRYGSFRAWWSS